jgi:hypothetical protein
MLERFDIALPFDRQWTDGAGKRRTADRSRHGLHALVGNGTTSIYFPTWDESRGIYIFDGVDDSIQLDQAEDVNNILTDMASIQDETYLVYFSPLKATATSSVWVDKRESAALRLTIVADDLFRFELAVVGAEGTEIAKTGAGEVSKYIGRDILFAWVRSSNSQKLYADGIEIFSATSTSRDASNTGKVFIGRAAPGLPLPAGAGYKYFGYSRSAFTGAKLRAISKYFKEML